MANDDDDFDLDGALEQSLAQMEANETNANNNNNNNDRVINIDNENKEDGNNLTNPEDDAIMQEALNAVQQSINNANDAQSNNDMMNDDEMKDFFNEIFKSFSNLDDDADDESLDKALKKVMTQFFDSNQLKEPVQIICNKYPLWLEENKDSLSSQEYENYRAQYELYREANTLLSAPKPDTSRIMDILLKTFSYGSLPPAVMDGMMPDELKQFADQMAAFEKDIDSNNNNDNNNDNNNSNSKKRNRDAMENNNNAGGSNNNSLNRDDDMNPEEAMKFFQQLMGMQNNGNKDDQKDNDFMPNLNDLPQLNEAEMQQFKQLMNQGGCSIM